jgi:hypothetical protein
MPKLSNRDVGLMCVGGALTFALAYYARSNTGDVLKPQEQGENQFTGIAHGPNKPNLLGERASNNAIDCDPKHHFYHPGYDPEPTAQKLITLPIRYPFVSGGNISTVMHHGWSVFQKGSPDNPWRTNPPSEVTI